MSKQEILDYIDELIKSQTEGNIVTIQDLESIKVMIDENFASYDNIIYELESSGSLR